MSSARAEALTVLPPIPAKRYFTIGEVSDLCGVKPHVLRYWEQEFTQLRPIKRRGNRRYYQHHEVLLVRRIRELLYEQGFTISGARNRLDESGRRRPGRGARVADPGEIAGMPAASHAEPDGLAEPAGAAGDPLTAYDVRGELLQIRALLSGPAQ
jgi:DNA-binding transcriptional MerR regulator